MATSKKIKKPITILGAKPADIENYIKFVEEKDIVSLNIQEHGVEVEIERGAPIVSAVQTAPAVMPTAPAETAVPSVSEEQPAETVSESPAPASSADDDKYTKITSPIVGTFYEAPSPTSDPFVQVGDVVEKGQTVCIVEAMKVMNTINSEVKGKIVKKLVENGQPVKQGEVLFLIDPV